MYKRNTNLLSLEHPQSETKPAARACALTEQVTFWFVG